MPPSSSADPLVTQHGGVEFSKTKRQPRQITAFKLNRCISDPKGKLSRPCIQSPPPPPALNFSTSSPSTKSNFRHAPLLQHLARLLTSKHPTATKSGRPDAYTAVKRPSVTGRRLLCHHSTPLKLHYCTQQLKTRATPRTINKDKKIKIKRFYGWSEETWTQRQTPNLYVVREGAVPQACTVGCGLAEQLHVRLDQAGTRLGHLLLHCLPLHLLL